MFLPRNFVGVLGHGGPTSPQSFSEVPLLGLEMPYSPLLGGVQEITFCASSPPTVVTLCVLNRTRSTAGPPRRISPASPTAGSTENHRLLLSPLLAHVLTTRKHEAIVRSE